MVVIEYQQLDDGVQIPMFDIEFHQAPVYFLCIAHVSHSSQWIGRDGRGGVSTGARQLFR